MAYITGVKNTINPLLYYILYFELKYKFVNFFQ